LWGNTAPTGPQIYNKEPSLPIVRYSDIEGGWFGEGNIDADPQFVDTENLHLSEGSPCIDAGNNSAVPPSVLTDLDGNPRIWDGDNDSIPIVDMGVYEFQYTRLVADAGPDQVVECMCNTEEGTKATLDGTGSHNADGGLLTYTWTGPFVESPLYGATPIVTLENGCPGDYVITLVVNDGIESSEHNEVLITVVDTMPPEFTLSVNPAVLWPPNHEMIKITPSWTLSDKCDASPEVSLVGVVISAGDDIQIGDDDSIHLRAECGGSSSGRIYTITYRAIDDYENATQKTATVTVPHDQRSRRNNSRI